MEIVNNPDQNIPVQPNELRFSVAINKGDEPQLLRIQFHHPHESLAFIARLTQIAAFLSGQCAESSVLPTASNDDNEPQEGTN